MTEKHFNQLSPDADERLTLLAEECAEVIQAVAKIQRHGYASRHPNGGPTNREMLAKEVGHVQHAIDRMLMACDFNMCSVIEARDKKRVEIEQYLHHQSAWIAGTGSYTMGFRFRPTEDVTVHQGESGETDKDKK